MMKKMTKPVLATATMGTLALVILSRKFRLRRQIRHGEYKGSNSSTSKNVGLVSFLRESIKFRET